MAQIPTPSNQQPAAPAETQQPVADPKPAVQQPAAPATKVYFTNVPNSGVQVMRGPGVCERVEFRGSRLETSDPEIIAHMDAIADKPGSAIFTEQLQEPSADAKAVAADIAAAAAAAHSKLIDAGERTA